MEDCKVCSEMQCENQRCKDIIQSIEEIKFEMHSLETLIDELYPH